MRVVIMISNQVKLTNRIVMIMVMVMEMTITMTMMMMTVMDGLMKRKMK